MMRLFDLYYKFSKCAQSKNECKATIEKLFNKIYNILISKDGFELFVKYDFMFENVYIITRQVLPELSLLTSSYRHIMGEMKLKAIENFTKDEQENDLDFLQRKFHAIEVSMVYPQDKIELLFEIFKEAFELIPQKKADFNETRNVYHKMAMVVSNFSSFCIPEKKKTEIEDVLSVYFDYEINFANEHFDASIIDSYLSIIINSFNNIVSLSPKDINKQFSKCKESLKLICDSVKKMIELRCDPYVGERYYLESNGGYELTLLLLLKLSNKLKSKKKLFDVEFGNLEQLISVLKYNSAIKIAYFENPDDNRIENILTIVSDSSLTLSDMVVQIWPDCIKLLKYFETLDEFQFKSEERLFWIFYATLKYLEIEFLRLPLKKRKYKDLSKQIEYLRNYCEEILESKTKSNDVKCLIKN